MAKLDFSYLVSPLTVREFVDQFWQKSAHFIKHSDADRYRGLIDAADASAILAMSGELPADAVEVIGGIQTNQPTGPATDLLANSFNQGATIRVKAIERFCPPLGMLCRNLEEELGFPVRANLYCTPGNSRGFNLHYDTHEVFVLQLLGKKQWQVFESTLRLPLEFVPPLPFENDREALKRARGGSKAGQDVTNEAELGPLVLEPLLEPGDCLYLPRGFVHQAAAQAEPSVHLTIGVHVLTWLDLLAVALGQAANRNEDFRRALPVGLFKQASHADEDEGESGNDRAREFEKDFDALAKRFGRDAVFADAVRELSESFARRSSGGSPGGNHNAVGKLRTVDGINSETRLAGNGPLRFYLAADGTMAGLACDEKELWLPVSFATALRFVAEQNEFRPDEIPGLVSDNSKLAFVRHLIKDGFVHVADE